MTDDSMSMMNVPNRWLLADEEQAAMLGLPHRVGGWGLMMVDEPRETYACDRVLVAALEERGGDVPGWDARVQFRATGWPGDDSPLEWQAVPPS